jgi:hypothetical protein
MASDETEEVSPIFSLEDGYSEGFQANSAIILFSEFSVVT